MAANTRKVNRKNVRHGLPWIALGLVILVATMVFSFKPSARALLLGESKTTDAVPEPPVRIDSDDTVTKIEAKLREEYDLRLKSELASELKKARILDLEKKEPPSPSVIFKRPQGIVSDITKLGNGIPLKTEVLYGTGETAIEEARLHDSYTATYQLKMRIPRPATTIAEIEKGTPGLSKILPGFTGLFPMGFVSPWHETLHRNKISEIRRNSNQLETVLSKPDSYDCNTILHLKSEKGRKVFFLQADMDAILKGSDGDRLQDMPDSHVNSIHYDPFTSYHWKKSTKTPNPMVAGWERRIGIGSKELENPDITDDRKSWVEERISMLRRGIEAMNQRSYLVSAHDPYIVLPLGILKDFEDPYTPEIGDYAVVIHGRKLYPCIVGDKGDDFRVGEASVRLAAELNPEWKSGVKAIPYPRVGYLVFPGSRETIPEAPDYAKWRKKCFELLNEIGGIGNGFEFHQWTDTFSGTEEKGSENVEGQDGAR